MLEEHRGSGNHEAVEALARDCIEGLPQSFALAAVEKPDRHVDAPCVLFESREHELRTLVARVGEESDPLRSGCDFTQQLDPFRADVGGDNRQSGRIAARARKARDQSRPDRISQPGNHDWHVHGCALCGKRRRRAGDDDHSGPKNVRQRSRRPFSEASSRIAIRSAPLFPWASADRTPADAPSASNAASMSRRFIRSPGRRGAERIGRPDPVRPRISV